MSDHVHVTEALKDSLWRGQIVNDLHYGRGYALADIVRIVGCSVQHCRTLLNPPPAPVVLNGKK